MSLITNNDFTLGNGELTQLNDWVKDLREKMDRDEEANTTISVTFKFSSGVTSVTAACGWVTSKATIIRN